MLSHKNLLSNAQSLSEAWRFTSEDRLLHALPIFHAHGLFVAVNVSLNVGASMIFLPKFDIDVVMDKIGICNHNDGRSNLLHTHVGRRTLHP